MVNHPQGEMAGDRSSRWAPLDAAYDAYQATTEEPPWGSLIGQTLLTAPERRRLLEAIGPRDGWKVLDVGTGYGPIPLELAHLAALEAVGTDIDPELLSVAEGVAGPLRTSGWLRAGSSVRFVPGDAYELPFGAAEFDLVTARLVFQHLAEPGRAASEMARVLAHGGLALVYDVDDGLSAAWPPAAAEVQLLDQAYTAAQGARGGDREVGRKLSGYLAEAGLDISQVLVLPQAVYEGPGAEDLARPVTTARYRAQREAMIATGLLDAPTFDRFLQVSEQVPSVARCRIESQVAVLARKA